MTVGKDIYPVGSCTQCLCYVPVNLNALLLARIFDVLADAVFQVAVLVLEGAALGEDIARGCADAQVDAADTRRGGYVTCNAESYDELLYVLNLLGSLPFLLRPSAQMPVASS